MERAIALADMGYPDNERCDDPHCRAERLAGNPDPHDPRNEGQMNDIDALAICRAALEKIREGRGTFSLDPLIHAENTINEMIEIADKALDATVQNYE